MKKLYLIPLLLCLIVGMSRASGLYGDAPFTFPGCSIGVSASYTGSTSSVICSGSSISLLASTPGGIPPFTYSWSPVAGLSNPAIANPVATPTVSTIYTVTVTDNSGCTGTASVSITVHQAPVANPDTVLMDYLTGHTLSARGGTPP